MWYLRRVVSRLYHAVRPGRADAELARELASHLSLLEEELVRRGLTPGEARRQARIAIGGIEGTKERHRDERSFRWLDDLRRDVPYALRAFARAPGFTAVVVVTLALGIGANTAMFSALHAVLLRPLAYAGNSDRLVRMMAHMPAEPPAGAPRRVAIGLNAAEIAEIRARTRTLSHVGTAGVTLMGLSGHDDAARLQGARVSSAIFPMLGARPLLGRTIVAGDESVGRDAVILLSHAAWRRFFNGDPGIVGRTVTLNSVLGRRTQREYSVIGVMPPEFTFPYSYVQFWIPLYVSQPNEPEVRGPMLGLLADGATPEAAATELAPIVGALRNHAADVRYEVVREQDEIAAPVRPALLVLMTAVGLVLLIACVNVANLLFARAAARQREAGVRAALGAGRGRLIRQALTESWLLALLGGVAGLAVATGAIGLLRTLATTLGRVDLTNGLNFPRLEEVRIDPVVLAFTAATSLVTGLLFGLAPALRSAVSDPMAVLRDRVPMLGRYHARRLGGTLVVAQVAMATVLLVGGALLVHGFLKLSRVDAGYDPSNVLTFQVALPVDRYPDERLKAFAEAMVAQLRAVPGVHAAAYANQLPMVGIRDTSGGLWRTPDPNRRPSGRGPDARFVSRDYFDTMRIHIVAGRGFTEQDGAGQPQVLIVNQTMARQEFPDEDPIGQLVFVGRNPTPWRIVGIVADVRQFGLDREPEAQMFADLRQWSSNARLMPLFPTGAYYAVRTNGPPEALMPAVRRIVGQLDASAGIFHMAPMTSLVATTVARPRMYAVLLGVFAGIGAVLALVGIYGVMAYAVTQRTREIGIRMALGAQRTEVVGLILRQGLVLALAGVAVGIAGARGASRYLDGMLYGLTPLDAGTFAAVSVSFVLVAVLAAYVPARRATKVDPLIALRHE